MNKTLVFVLSLLILSQVHARYDYRSRFGSFFGKESESTETPTPESIPTPESSTTSVSTPSTVSSESTETVQVSVSISEKTPTPAPVPACQAWQDEVDGACICNDNKCNAFLNSHACTEETAAGECLCSDMECGVNDQVCDENTFEGRCVECNEKNVDICGDHQGCYRNACVCLDEMCEFDQVCKRQYSASTECVECREDSDCGEDWQICNDEGTCECRDKLTPEGMVCSSQDADGVLVQCREDNTSQCSGDALGCEMNECVCKSELCPKFTLCSLEDDAEGECTNTYECQTDADCAGAGTFCDDTSGDDDDDTDFEQRFDDNSCECNTVSCGDALNTVDDTFVCVEGTYCMQECTTAEEDGVVPDACPENTNCIEIDPTVEVCVPNNIGCRADNGVIYTSCPNMLSCLGASVMPGIETAPFCLVHETDFRNDDDNLKDTYRCPEPFTAPGITEDNNFLFSEDDSSLVIACISEA